MRGINELLLNEATMMEAVQLWVDANMKPDVVVTNITYRENDNDYKIEIQPKDEKDEN